jgi:hypothetical protein
MLRYQPMRTISQLPHSAQNPGKVDSFRPHSWHIQRWFSSALKGFTSEMSVTLSLRSLSP